MAEQGTRNRKEPSSRGKELPRKHKKFHINKEAKPDISKVKKNKQGGVSITEEEIEAAFKFLDHNNTGRITLHSLKKRLSFLYKNVPIQQYKFLMGDKLELTVKDLKELLLENTVENFDPVAEAFKVYDPENSGYIAPATIRELFNELELTKINDEDLSILLEAADMDKDGRIGLEDFRALSDASRAEREKLEREMMDATKGISKLELQPGPNVPSKLFPF